MKYAILAILFLFTLFIVLPVSILVLRDKIRAWKRRETPEQRAARITEWRQRKLHPRPEEVEKLCGGLLPKRLLEMYADTELILKTDLDVCIPSKNSKEVALCIWEFEPLDVQALEGRWDLSEFGKGWCFAGDGMGNFFWVPVSDERHKDGPVYFICHDPWGNEKVADSLEEFLTWLRARPALK
jgi:hypothetical protein